MKKAILFLLFYTINCLSAYSIGLMGDSLLFRKQNFSITIGGNVSKVLGDSYIYPDRNCTSTDNNFCNVFVGLEDKPSIGYRTGLLYSFGLSKRLSIITGLEFSNRSKTLIVRDMDTVLLYAKSNNPTTRLKMYTYSAEFPLLLDFLFNEFNISMGCNVNFSRFILFKARDINNKEYRSKFKSQGIFFVPTLKVGKSIIFRDSKFRMSLQIDQFAHPNFLNFSKYNFFTFSINVQYNLFQNSKL